MVEVNEALDRPFDRETLFEDLPAAVAHAMGTHIDLFQRIVISPASVSAVTWHAGGPIVLTVNSTGRPLTELKPA